jgi:hypothetical protein
MTNRLGATRVLAALIAAGAIAGTALAVDPSASPSSSPSASASEVPSAAAPSASGTTDSSEAPSTAGPSIVATPAAPSASAPAPQVKESEPEDETDGPPSADKIADVVGRLKGAGIPATAAQVQELSGKVGLGGAVRVLAFSQASGKTPAQILAMFTSGMGWGRISRELNLSIGPGIGWIMGHGQGNGHGKDKTP